MPICHHTLADHEALKLDWSALSFAGYQETEHPDGSEHWLALSNAACGSTLARDCLPNEYPTARAWWAGFVQGRQAAQFEAVL
jgi:hypothetical protein